MGERAKGNGLLMALTQWQYVRQALEQVLTGTIGSVRTMTATAIGMGHTPWHGQLVSQPRFDIRIARRQSHEATPVQYMGSHRLEQLDIEIDVFHSFASNIQEDKRGTVRDQVQWDVEAAKQALQWPGNLSVTSSSNATGIISGMLVGVASQVILEDWDQRPPRSQSRITGTAILRVVQPTS